MLTSTALAGDVPAEDASLRERIEGLIDELGHPQFTVREAAQAELARLGPEAFDALTIAENHTDLEVAARAHYLLGLVQFDWASETDPTEIKLALGDYETLDTQGRLSRISQLSGNLALPQITALCRLVRFEKSHVLSKRAALALIAGLREPTAEADRTIHAGVANSPRPAADWLRVFVQSHNEPEAAVQQWAALVASEERVLEQTPERSSPEIVAALLKQHVEQLERLERTDEAQLVVRRLIEQETGGSESLVELIRWLVDHQSWSALDELEKRFADRFTSDVLLAYALAEARQQAGDAVRAEQLAEQAFAMNPGDGAAHYEIGDQLRKRGRTKWAEQELRYAIEVGPPESYSALRAQFQLADMLHDQMRDLEAGQLLEKCLATLERTAAEQGENNNGVDLRGLVKAVRNGMTARLNYYFACHAKEQNDREQEQQLLELALEADPLDADVLIGLYRLPNQSDELRRRTERQIESAARQFRTQIAEQKREPAAQEKLASAYNQLAWLLSNTNRNQDEALRCSQESLKLMPDQPGLLDTLARCYFAAGQLDEAVKYQRKAVQLEPHSGLMRRQLKQFEDALAEKAAAKI